MNILMIGATGHFAGLVLPELLKHGVTVRALIRPADEADAARRQGAAETVVGDLGDPASLRRAAAGMDGVFHLNPAFAPHEAEMGVAMVEAAQAAGVRKFVFSSVIHPSLGLMNHAAKRLVEAALYDSGLDFTVLQPAMFMQNLAGSWAQAAKTGQLAQPYSTQVQVCFVDYRDVAEAVALAFTTDRLSRGTFELCAGGQINGIGLAGLMGEALGRPGPNAPLFAALFPRIQPTRNPVALLQAPLAYARRLPNPRYPAASRVSRLILDMGSHDYWITFK